MAAEPSHPEERSHLIPVDPPTSYCVRYEGNGSKRWDGKTIFVDSKLLLESYEHRISSREGNTYPMEV